MNARTVQQYSVAGAFVGRHLVGVLDAVLKVQQQCFITGSDAALIVGTWHGNRNITETQPSQGSPHQRRPRLLADSCRVVA